MSAVAVEAMRFERLIRGVSSVQAALRLFTGFMSTENSPLNIADAEVPSIETIIELLDRCTSASNEEKIQAHLLLPDMTSQERLDYYYLLCEAARAEGIHILPVKG